MAHFCGHRVWAIHADLPFFVCESARPLLNVAIASALLRLGDLLATVEHPVTIPVADFRPGFFV